MINFRIGTKTQRMPCFGFWVLVFGIVSVVHAGKQKIVLHLRTPLRAEAVHITAPAVTTGHGETRDLETTLQLGDAGKTPATKDQSQRLKLDLAVRSVGHNAVQVTLTLPDPGFVEIDLMDVYGKNLASLLSANLSSGVYPLPTLQLKDVENSTMKVLTLKVNGKMPLKIMLGKVR